MGLKQWVQTIPGFAPIPLFVGAIIFGTTASLGGGVVFWGIAVLCGLLAALRLMWSDASDNSSQS